MDNKTLIIADDRYRDHVPGGMHPECPERYEAAVQGIRHAVDAASLVWATPRRATEDEVALCHTRDYIEMVKLDVLDKVPCLRTGDTDVCPESFEVALLAVGGVLDAVDAVFDGSARNAFCPVRPPGHHATADRGMGFCIFNNIAIGARYAQQRHGIERVLIVDWDVHHGNGTQDIFYDDPSVFSFSTHQWPLYPGSGQRHQQGAGDGLGFTMNRPVGAGAGGHELMAALREGLIPAMRRFKPELIMMSAGFDGRISDPLGGLALKDSDFAELTGMTMDLAAAHADSRLVSALEGGYDLPGLASAVGAHVGRLVQ